ncbi:MAG: hypothetical protein EB023_02845 [Flavobacteriia bacterium]|nr:hypothetical protein [Flavobacteriia bacterium]
MAQLIRFVFLFFLVLFLQVFVSRHVNIGFGAQLFFLPIFIMMLPFQINIFIMMILGFVLGISTDMMTNTFGLHASSLVLIAYLRPLVFNTFPPKEGYDAIKQPIVSDMGWTWFLLCYGLLLFSYVFWFIFFEVFKWSEVMLILRNLFSGFLLSLVVALVFQLFFRNRALK